VVMVLPLGLDQPALSGLGMRPAGRLRGENEVRASADS
jgi:hypothetical protein